MEDFRPSFELIGMLVPCCVNESRGSGDNTRHPNDVTERVNFGLVTHACWSFREMHELRGQREAMSHSLKAGSRRTSSFFVALCRSITPEMLVRSAW